jgi:hypothetical protein
VLRPMTPTTQPWRRDEAGVAYVPVEVEQRCARCGHERRRRRSRAVLPPVTTEGVWGGSTGNNGSVTPLLSVFCEGFKSPPRASIGRNNFTVWLDREGHYNLPGARRCQR